MKLPPPSGFVTPDGIAAWARRLVGSIAASWAVDHNADGSHKFPWIDIPYDGTRYTGSAGMPWTVEAGDQLLLRYRVIGTSCLMQWRIRTSDCGGGSNQLFIRLPDGIAAADASPGWHYYDDAGTEGWGLARVDTATLAKIQLFKAGSASNWTATTTDNTYTEGSIEFRIA